jgi:BarA-like signal transduction histidine kinase
MLWIHYYPMRTRAPTILPYASNHAISYFFLSTTRLESVYKSVVGMLPDRIYDVIIRMVTLQVHTYVALFPFFFPSSPYDPDNRF